MPIPLPQLDDRRWSDLIDEGRALIPLYAQDWTDHNVHDPGITFMELFAWIAEMDIYQLNRIPDLHKRKFVQLVGMSPQPPSPAHVVLAFERKNANNKLSLPATTEFAGADPAGTSTSFRTLHEIAVTAAKVQAIQGQSGATFEDLTDLWKRREPLAVFGAEPAPGSALYLGLTQALPTNEPVSFYFRFSNPRSDATERKRLLAEARARRRSCKPPQPDGCRQNAGTNSESAAEVDNFPAHHSVRTVWEFLAQTGGKTQWLPLAAQDTTRSLTLAGSVQVRVPAIMAKSTIGKVPAQLYYVRCRLVAGAYDATPMANRIEINAVASEQSVPVWKQWKILPDASVSGTAPKAGDRTSLQFAFDQGGNITTLKFPSDDPDAPTFLVLDYQPPLPPKEGRLTLEVVRVGVGTGTPYQTFPLPQTPVDVTTFTLFSLEDGVWKPWVYKPDLISSHGDDLHFLLEPTTGQVSFGDGEAGRVPPPGALIFAAYNTTRAEDGNIGPGAIQTLQDSPHNRALLGDVAAVRVQLASITNSAGAAGGTAAETLAHTIGRAIELREARLRAVTAEDYEFLAHETPGVTLARVTARANLHPSFPCFQSPGMIT